jgi:hypothetical protein
MAKLLLYGDLHIGASRVDNDKILKTIDFVNQTAKAEKVDGIINMGDTLDCSGGRKQLLNPATISLLQQLDFSEHYILRGNHEYHMDGDLLTVLNCKQFIDKPTIIFDCLFIPYTRRIDKSLYPNHTFKFAFSHCDFQGGRYDNGHEYKGKSDKILDGVNYEKLYLGHYHIRQQITKNVHAIGATQSRIKSSNDEPMGITILDTMSDRTVFFENPYAYFELVGSKQKNQVSSEFMDNTSEEVLAERQSIIDDISTLANSDELINNFFKAKGLDNEIIIALTKGTLPNDFE